jgi:hypothetical protein
MRIKAMKPPVINQKPTNSLRLHGPVLPAFPERLRRLLEATYAAHGGAEYMNLSDWRDLEVELKRRWKYENQ